MSGKVTVRVKNASMQMSVTDEKGIKHNLIDRHVSNVVKVIHIMSLKDAVAIRYPPDPQRKRRLGLSAFKMGWLCAERGEKRELPSFYVNWKCSTESWYAGYDAYVKTGQGRNQ